MKKILLIVFLAFLINSVSAIEISVEVRSINNQKLSGITVYAFNGRTTINATTNADGIATINVSSLANLELLAADLNRTFGIAAMKVNSSLAVYQLIMPRFPKNKEQAASMYDAILKAYGAYSDYQDLKGFASYSRGTGTGMLGIPGIFNISPIPVKDKDGVVGLQISGSLARPLYNVGNCMSGLYGCEYRTGAI